jgi:CBS domain-containing protein
VMDDQSFDLHARDRGSTKCAHDARSSRALHAGDGARRTLMGVISFYDVAKAVVDGQDFETACSRPTSATGRSRASRATSRPRPEQTPAVPDRGVAGRIKSSLQPPPPGGGVVLEPKNVRQHPRPPVRVTELRREPRAGDRLRDRRLPARDGAVGGRHPARARPAPPGHLAPRHAAQRARLRSRSCPGVYEGRRPARRSAC